MSSPDQRLVACVVSPHAFLLQELGRALEAAHVAVSTHLIAYSLAPHLECACGNGDRVWIIDGCLPVQSTESLVSALRSAYPVCKVVVVAEALTEALVFPLLRTGVRGFLTYGEAHSRLAQAVAAVAQGRTWMPRAHLAAFVELLLGQDTGGPQGATWLALSQREKEVLPLLLKNLANKEIAERLHIAERTVKFHVSNLLAKFGAERRADLILQTLRGWPQG